MYNNTEIENNVNSNPMCPPDQRDVTYTEIPLPEIVVVTPYPPRETEVAAYSKNLINGLNTEFEKSFLISICAVESSVTNHTYKNKVKYVLDTSQERSFIRLAKTINLNEAVQIVLIQHDFSFFEGRQVDFIQFLGLLKKPVVTTFHSVLSDSDPLTKRRMLEISNASSSIIVSDPISKEVLICDYAVPENKIVLIMADNEPVTEYPASESKTWEGIAIAHALLFQEISRKHFYLHFRDHITKVETLKNNAS